METLLGVWQSGNLFITEEGIERKVIPYNYLYNEYKNKLPLKCFITLEDNRSIIAVLPVE